MPINRPLSTMLSAAMALPVALSLHAPSAASADEAATERPAAVEPFPSEWFWGNEQVRRRHDALVGMEPPPLAVSRWFGAPQKLSDLRGKVVVVDFWGTWCPPCMRALPMHKSLIEEHAKSGLIFVAVHDHRRGIERIETVIKEHGISYPIAVDDAGKSAEAWRVSFWPTYGVIDRHGRVRGVGLTPEHLPTAVSVLIAEAPPEDLAPAARPTVEPAAPADPPAPRDAGAATITLASLPMEWIERLPETRAPIERLIGKPAPPLPVGQWINSRPMRLEDLRGKVVLLDFWATWCAPCITAIPELNRLQDRYARHGLVVVGICHGRGAESMGDVVRQHRIRYPVVSDPDLTAVRAYRVDTYPDYYLIDRQGRLRGVDLRTESVELAIERLLAE